MITNINFEILIFVFVTFLIFSYFLKYLSLLLKNFYKSKKSKNSQFELYESGAPIYYKIEKKIDLQSYLLALFFLIFELELFLTYPILVNSQYATIKIISHYYKEIFLDDSFIENYILNDNNILIWTIIADYQEGIFIAIYVFFISIIFALALEWLFEGLEFLLNKIGRNGKSI